MLTLPSSVRIYVFTQPTDMRCGFNKLSMLAESMMGQDPLSGHLFVFFNRRANRCKVLFWDRTGYCIWYKQLQQGTFEAMANPAGDISLEGDLARLALIVEGIELSNARCRRRCQQKNV